MDRGFSWKEKNDCLSKQQIRRIFETNSWSSSRKSPKPHPLSFLWQIYKKHLMVLSFHNLLMIFQCSKFYKLNEIRLQKYLSAVFTWCTKWRIKLNPTKTKIVHFHQSKRILKTKLKLGKEPLKSYPYVTFLGMTLDLGLSLSKHVEEKIEEVQYIKAMLFKLKCEYFGPSEKNMISLYKIFLRSKFEYGC